MLTSQRQAIVHRIPTKLLRRHRDAAASQTHPPFRAKSRFAGGAVGAWLSYDDLIQLVERTIDTPITGFLVVYSVSNNDRAPVDNVGASHLGSRPRDNAERFAKAVCAEAGPLDPHDPANICHGGPLTAVELGDSGVAHLNLKADDTGKS